MSEPEAVILDRAVLEQLTASVSGDTAFVRQLVQTYLDDSAGQVEAIETSVEARDPDALVRPAHTLKSSSATLGAERLAARARELEMAGRSGTIDDATSGMASQLRSDWEAAVAALQAWAEGE